jgi:magnesium chelatase family protein
VALARTHSVTLVGVQGHAVEIEADIENGLVALLLVGLPDTALREARDRIRAAIVNSREEWPLRRITVGLSPASLPKRGSSFDLGIAVSILAAAGAVPADRLPGLMFLGELGLDGRVRAVRGVLPSVAAVGSTGFGTVVVPAANAAEASLVPGVEVLAANSLAGVLDWLRSGCPPGGVPGAARWTGADDPAGQASPGGTSPAAGAKPAGPAETAGADEADGAAPLSGPDLSDIVGQPTARRAAELCAAGGHHLLLLGPPGAGKTMLAERLPTLLPRLDPAAALEVSAIHSVAGVLPADRPLLTDPPFCAPHHTATRAALVGGGSGVIRPGAASLAHHGCLFLDEAPEFARTPRCAPPAAGVRRDRDSQVRRDREVPGPVHAGHGGQPVPVRPGHPRPRRLHLRPVGAPALYGQAVRPASRPGGREGRVPPGQPGRTAQRPGFHRTRLRGRRPRQAARSVLRPGCAALLAAQRGIPDANSATPRPSPVLRPAGTRHGPR